MHVELHRVFRTAETYVNIEADRRPGDDYVLELRARFFTDAEAGDPSYAIEVTITCSFS